MPGAPIEVMKRVPLFADLTAEEVAHIGRMFKLRRFDAGETIIREGSGGAAIYLIESGEARVFLGQKEHSTLKAGDYFGEIAMFDEGARMASIVASTDLVCYGLTYWDFRPVVEGNGVIGWKLLHRMVQMMRANREK